MIRPLRGSDIVGLNGLPPDDWRFDYEGFLRRFLLDKFFYAFVQEENGVVVGTGNVLLRGKVGWLANIIVAENNMGKGLGTEMTNYLVKFLREKGSKTQLLIATRSGESIYKKQGFTKISAYQSFDTITAYHFTKNKSIRLISKLDLQELHKLDFDANGEDRSHLINRFYDNGFGYFSSEGKLLGAYLPDFGRGLVLSRSQEAGRELLKLKHSESGRRTLVPIENQSAIKYLESIALKKGEQSSRMILGKGVAWNPKFIYSYGSGYCG